jgi:hypothetical protein
MVFGIGGTVIAILALVCAILVIYDVLTKNRKLSDTAKIIWIICAIIFSIITAIVYWLVEKK